jgi:hypothetical protein
MNVSRLISFPDLKVAPGVKSHDYHVLLMQMIAVGIQNILPVNVREAIVNFCFFFNSIGQKVLTEEALKKLEKRHYGKINHLTTEEAQQAQDIILGIFLASSHPVIVLFDLGASHSFISSSFVVKHHMPIAIMK